MTAPVLSPVRWWRDDATRYVTRGPQQVPAAAQPDPAWMFELLAPLDPETTWTMEQWFGAAGQTLVSAVVAPQTFGPSPLEAWSVEPDILGDLRIATGRTP